MMKIYGIWFWALLISAAVIESNTNYGFQYDEEFTHKVYNTKQDILKSNVLNKRSTLSNTIFHIKATKTYLQLGRDKKMNWLKLKVKKPKTILFVETRPGPMLVSIYKNFPYSKCFSAELSSGPMSVTKSVAFSSKVDVELSFEVSFDLASIINPAAQVPASNKIGLTVLSSWGKSTSVKCTAQSGRRAQIFGTARFIYFPRAEARLLLYSTKHNEFSVEEDWSPVYTSENHKEYGMVTYDDSRGVEVACVDDEKLLECSSELLVRPYDPEYDICEGLSLSLNRGTAGATTS